jgi:hypothetical protein
VLRTKLYFDRGCVKSILPPSAAKFYFETDLFFMILLRKIMKNKSVSNFNLVRSAVKILFTQPQKKILLPKAAKGFLHNPHPKNLSRQRIEIIICRGSPF